MSDLMNSLEGLFSKKEYENLHWQGDFEAYQKKLIANPQYSFNSGTRALDMILEAGYEVDERLSKLHNVEVIRYKFFSDATHLPEERIMGLELPIMRFVSDLKQSAYELGKEKTIKLLHGPVGASKSSFVKLLKKGSELWSKTDQGAVYALGFTGLDDQVTGEIKWCEMLEHPLHAIPESFGKINPRAILIERWNKQISGDLKLKYYPGACCPECDFYFDELSEKYEGDWRKVIANNIRVKRWTLSEKDRRGITTFQPRDEKNIDSTELTGDINYRKIVQYGSESDPRAFNFDGEILKANQGMIEFIEIFKLPREFLYDLLELTEDRTAKPPKFPKIFVDTLLIAHTNEPEFKKLQLDETQEAIRDRTVVTNYEYLTEYSKEAEVYKKFFPDEVLARVLCTKTGKRGVHVAPHTYEMAALWAVCTRLHEPEKLTLDLINKAKLYDFQEVREFSDSHITELKEEGEKHREGMFGISPRYVRNKIGNAITSSDTENCINPFNVLDQLKIGLNNYSLVGTEELRNNAKKLIDAVEKEELSDLLKEDVMTAVAADEDALKRMHANYIDNVKAKIKNEKVKDNILGRPRSPDEDLMNSIEEEAGIPEKRREAYRVEIMGYIGALSIEGKQFQYDTNQDLLKAYQRKLFKDHRHTIKLEDIISSIHDDKVESEIQRITTNLKKMGYCDICANDVLTYISDLMNRGNSAR